MPSRNQVPRVPNLSIVLASRPKGEPTTQNFGSREDGYPVIKPGEVLYRSIYVSLDPYLRGRMSDAKSYAAPLDVNEPIQSGFVGEVIESDNPNFAEGDRIAGMGPWSVYAKSNGQGIQKITNPIPLTAVLGVLGMPGLTAYVGLFDIGKMKPGETVLVSAAAGAVGSVVGQLAKINGGRAIGIAGGPQKCAHVLNDLGFDACIDYKSENVNEALCRICPDGIDVCFENVGGTILEAAMANLKDKARIVLCGLISEYNAEKAPPGPNLRPLLVHKATIEGFIVSDHWHRMPAFLEAMVPNVLSGKIQYRVDIVRGLDEAPRAFMGLLKGKNFGKLLVQVSDEPRR